MSLDIRTCIEMRRHLPERTDVTGHLPRFDVRRGIYFMIALLLLVGVLGGYSYAQEDEDEEKEPQTIAEADGLLIEAEVLFRGYFKQGCYFPVKVSVENSGRGRRGEIRIVSQDPQNVLSAVFVAECDIPANSRKTFVLYPYLLNDDPSPALYVQYFERSPLLTTQVELQHVRDDERLWVEVSDEGYDFGFLTDISLSECSSFSELDQYLLDEQAFGAPTGYPTYGHGSPAAGQNTYEYDPVHPLMTTCRPGDLPDRPEGYQAVDGVILNTRRYYELSEEQKAALTEWVISGGSVIVWLADDTLRYQGSFLTGAVDGSGWLGPSAITEEPVRTTLTGLRTMPAFVGESAVDGDFPITYTQQPSARTLLAESGLPVLQHIKLGRGDILLSGIDLSALSSAGARGLERYFSFMIGYLMSLDDRLNMDLPPLQPTYPYSRNIRGQANPFPEGSIYRILYEFDNVLQSDKLTALPGLHAISLFLASYVILIGPINYFILLKLRRREWLWYTIPVLVAGFCLFSYGWALGTKGSRLLLTRVSIEDAYPEQGIGWETSALGLFSPVARNYDIHLASERDLIRALEFPSTQMGIPGFGGGMGVERIGMGDALTLVQDGRNGEAYIRDSHIRIWSEAHYVSEGATSFPGIVMLEDVGLDGTHLTGTVNVDLDFDLHGAFLLYATRGGYVNQMLAQDPDGLVRSGSFDFDLNLDMRSSRLPSAVHHRSTTSEKAIQLRDTAISAIGDRRIDGSGEDELILAGWRSGAGDRAMSNPHAKVTADETLVLIHLPLRIEGGDFSVDAARGAIIAIQAGRMELETTSTSSALTLTNGRILYAVNFPPVVNPVNVPETLEINVSVDRLAGQAQVIVTVFNHRNGSWVEFPPFHATNTRVTVRVQGLGRYLAPDGRTMFIAVEGGASKGVDRVISLTGISIGVPTR